jgi:hypothetical protein
MFARLRERPFDKATPCIARVPDRFDVSLRLRLTAKYRQRFEKARSHGCRAQHKRIARWNLILEKEIEEDWSSYDDTFAGLLLFH